LATGKIDGSSEPSSSLVACRALRAPAYVNTDYGSKASTFDRIQVDALVRIATAAARMVYWFDTVKRLSS
jgi:hypothetical protein